MKSARPILYAIIGFVIGGIAGIFAIPLLFSNPESVSAFTSLAFPVGGGILLALIFGLLGMKLSKLQEAAERKPGYFLLMNVLIAAFIIASSIISFIIGVVLNSLPVLGQNSFIIFLGVVITYLFSAQFAVWYVVRKKYLQPYHDPRRIASITIGTLIGVAIIVMFLFLIAAPSEMAAQLGALSFNDYLQWIIGLAVTGASIYFFSKNALETQGR